MRFEGAEMCEFKVVVDGEEIFEDVVYARVAGNAVILRNILGQTKEIKSMKIVEVDVTSERLVLFRQ